MIEQGYTKKILDHGHIKLVEWMGSDERVVEAARQSTGKGFISWDPYDLCKGCGRVVRMKISDGSVRAQQHGPECDDVAPINASLESFPNGDMGLLDNLMRNRHTTPFEMGGEIIFEVKAPIMVFREWHRHRTQSYNEMSGRYVQMPNEHYLPEPGRIQKQSAASKQGSAEAMDQTFAMKVIAGLEGQQQMVYDSYDEWVEEGLAKEVARLNTPVSRYSQMWAKTDILNWLKFLTLRMRPAAQFEIRQYAEVVGEVIKSRWSRIWWLFEEYDLYAVRFSRTEMEILRKIIGEVELPPGPEHIDLISGVAKKNGLTGTRLKEFVLKVDKGGKELLANP